MKTNRREWTETRGGVTVYHSPELDRAMARLGAIVYADHIRKETEARQARAERGDFAGYGNGALKV